MKVENIYPQISRKRRHFLLVRRAFWWVFLALGAACAVVNLALGAPWWCPVAIWGMLGVWQCVFSPDMVERNMISQTVKALWYACVLLALIDTLLAPGWAQFVIPLVGFAALVATAVFFFMDVNGQRQNMMPLIWLVLASLAGLAAAGLGWVKMSWPIITLGASAGALALLGLAAFPKNLWRELKKRFHTR